MINIETEGVDTPLRLLDRQTEIVEKVDTAVGILATADTEGIVVGPTLLPTPEAARLSHHRIDSEGGAGTMTVHHLVVGALYVVVVVVAVIGEIGVCYLPSRGTL